MRTVDIARKSRKLHRMRVRFCVNTGDKYDGEHYCTLFVPERFIKLIEVSEGKEGCGMWFEVPEKSEKAMT